MTAKNYVEYPRDLSELLAEELPQQRWAIGGYIERPGHLVLAGRAGSGKTMLAIQLAIQASNPESRDVNDLGLDLGTEASRVAIVDGEMGRRRYHQRIHNLGLVHAVLPGAITHIEGNDLDLAAPADRAWLEQELDGHDIIIFDSLKKLTRGLAENDNDEMGGIVAGLTRLSKTLNATIITIHHRGTGDKAFRGATAILDQCDAMVAWSKVDDEGKHKLTARGDWTKIRDGAEPPDIFFDMQSSGLLVPADAPVPKPRPATITEQLTAAIVAALMTSPERTWLGSKVDLRRLVAPDAKPETFRQALEAATDEVPGGFRLKTSPKI